MIGGTVTEKDLTFIKECYLFWIYVVFVSLSFNLRDKNSSINPNRHPLVF